MRRRRRDGREKENEVSEIMKGEGGVGGRKAREGGRSG